MRNFTLLTAAVIAALLCSRADAMPRIKTLGIDGARAVLLCPEHPTASVILMPGGDGRIQVGFDGKIGRLRHYELVRTRFAYAARDLAVLVIDADVNLAHAVDTMRKVASPVIVIAAGRGTLRAAHGIADGARPDALVLVSGILSDASGHNENVAVILGSPQRLPHTLVIHHRHDDCAFTRAAGVAPFIKWADGRASTVWLDGGDDDGRSCGAQSHHGFAGLDASVVRTAATFR